MTLQELSDIYKQARKSQDWITCDLVADEIKKRGFDLWKTLGEYSEEPKS